MEDAKALEREGRFKDAALVLERFLRDHPRSAPHRLQVIRLLDKAGGLQEAEVHVSRVIADSTSPTRLVRLACEVLHRQSRNNEALSALHAHLARAPSDPQLLTVLTEVLLAEGRASDLVAALRPALQAQTVDPRAYLFLAGAQIAQGKLDDAESSLNLAERALSQRRVEESLAARVGGRVERARDYVRMVRETTSIVQRVPQPRAAKGLAVVFTNGSPQVSFMTALTVVQLKQKGWAGIYACADGWVDPGETGDVELDRLQRIFETSQKRLRDDPPAYGGLRHQWTIDWTRRVVSAEGMNFFEPFFATLCSQYRRYTIDIGSPHVQAAFQELLLQADATLSLCERLAVMARGRRIPVRVLSAKPHFVPNGVLRVFCDEIGHRYDMNFVYFGPGYDQYYANAKNKFIATASVENLTRYRDVQRISMRARKEQIEAWRTSGIDEGEIVRRVEDIIHLNRTHTDSLPPPAAALRERLLRAKQDGRPIVCLFGKILYDIAVPREGGPAHADLADWINHSIECAAGSDAIVLVKPHPNEINKTYAQPTEFFADLITVPRPDNVVVLGHRWFNIRDLLPILDLGILWSGSTALELGASGIPVVMCSDWGRLDYPVDFLVPKDRSDYRRFFVEAGRFRVSDEQRRLCALLIHFLSTEEIMIPFPYARLPVRHRERGPKEWRMEEVERFFKEGDRHIDRITARCL